MLDVQGLDPGTRPVLEFGCVALTMECVHIYLEPSKYFTYVLVPGRGVSILPKFLPGQTQNNPATGKKKIRTFYFILVAKMQCGPSRLLQFQRNSPNIPVTGYKRSNAFKLYEDGQLMYDKEGLPTDTTKNIVEAFDS